MGIRVFHGPGLHITRYLSLRKGINKPQTWQQNPTFSTTNTAAEHDREPSTFQTWPVPLSPPQIPHFKTFLIPT